MKRSLVLAGGGSRGSFQAPIIDKLVNENIKFDHIFGVSVGSVNGSVASLERAGLTDLWRELKRKNVFGGPASKYGIPGKTYQLLKILLGYENSFFKNEPLINLLRKHYDPSETKVPFTFGSTSLKDGRFHTFTIYPEDNRGLRSENDKQKIIKYLISSGTIPLLLSPVFDEFVDGGLKNLAPIGSAVKSGADEVFIVPTEPVFKDPEGYKEIYSPNIFGIGRSSLNIVLDETLQNDYKVVKKVNELVKKAKKKGVNLRRDSGEKYRAVNLHIIQPSKELGSPLDFSESVINERIKEGEKQIKSFLDEYKNKG